MGACIYEYMNAFLHLSKWEWFMSLQTDKVYQVDLGDSCTINCNLVTRSKVYDQALLRHRPEQLRQSSLQ